MIDYEPVTPEERAVSLAAARQILANLYRLPRLRVVGEGSCDDCGRSQVLFELEGLELCGRCAQSRQRAGEKAAA